MSQDLKSRAERGGALLAVLWLSAALSAIAFTLSLSVRTEFDRAALDVEQTKAYYLAQGAIEITMQRLLRPRTFRLDRLPGPDDAFSYPAGQRFLPYVFPAGRVVVEVIGETGKLGVQTASPEQLARLFVATGLPSDNALALAANIAAARKRGILEENGPEGPTFLPFAASLTELEDLLRIPGMTQPVLYGSYRENDSNQLVPVGGLYKHLTMRGEGMINANYASAEVLRAAGLAPAVVDAILRIRAVRPVLEQDIPGGIPGGEPGMRVGFGGLPSTFTLWARAELNGGNVRRTVGAKVRLATQAAAPGMAAGIPPVRVVRWYDIPF